jgi:glycosyltransferase involved in cell wall biosynthesis
MHQMPFLEHLQALSDAEVICIHAEDVPPDRLTLGWSRPEASRARLLSAAEAGSFDLIENDDIHSLHFFSGLHCHPYVSARLREAIARNARVGMIAEAHDGYGIRGGLRKLRSRLDSRRYSSRIAIVLAMGRLGVKWYRDAGFRPATIFPFAYVSEPRQLPGTPFPPQPRPFTIAYVGQLIHRKGVDLLFQALASLVHLPWRLEVAGVGPLETALKAAAHAGGFLDRVVWRYAIPNEQVATMLGGCDLLVLPSRFDGWGVVVNEALGAGTPVVCSDACGAADLVAKPVLGQVVAARSIADLATAIGERVHSGSPSSAARGFIREHAERFSPRSVAGYFLDIVRSVWRNTEPPTVPWRDVGASR